jgi:hypothetical protein
MREKSSEEIFAEVREDVELLSAPAEKQERWLEQHRVPVDEMALQLNDDVQVLFPRLIREGLLNESAKQAIAEIDAFFGTFSGKENSVLWTEEALYTEAVWEHIRDLARVALEKLDGPTGDRATPV